MKRAYGKYRTGTSSIHESKVGDIAPVHFGFEMNVALKEILNVKISQFHESGILSAEKMIAYEERGLRGEGIGPQVLTLEHLKGVFVVICGLLILSIAVFFAERVVHR
jgi:hypothetical protein